MSKKVEVKRPVTPSRPTATRTAAKDPGFREKELPFTKGNYKMLAIGCALMLLGYLLMTGGTKDIYSFRRITLSVLVLMGGFIFNIYAIMKNPKESQQPQQPQQEG